MMVLFGKVWLWVAAGSKTLLPIITSAPWEATHRRHARARLQRCDRRPEGPMDRPCVSVR